MEDADQGAQRPESLAEVGEDAVTTVGQSAPALTEQEKEELREELAKVEDEILTLSQVLAAKEKQVAEMKRKLGITSLNELKQNLTKGWQEVTTSAAYKKTSETLSQAGQKATAAFSSVGSAISRKLEDVRLQSNSFGNTPTFKSFEEKVDTLKTKISPTVSQGDLEEEGNATPTSDPVVTQPEASPIQDGQLH
ncbi:tumor protein D52 isoform X1 [Hypomesus transpacificus]|uniref:tumor protein D52 isoform X1 n=1 Tax=Hypomesus transpacificus TaxID=137520 RepID=UPI001F085C69|nr:tumor protein D52 isoform X1 [Hypomesus transpacificus]